MRTAGRVLLYILFLIPLVVAGGFVYHTWASIRDANQYPPYGDLVEVNGYAMHLYCVGEGSPTVVFEGGLGSVWLDWSKVQPEVGTFTRACAYDRAGYGWSDPTNADRTATQIARDLHSLLREAGEEEPYILVGHSSGALYIEAFHLLYGDEVSGVVMVDPPTIDTPAQSFERLEGEDREFIQGFFDEQSIDSEQRPPLSDGLFSIMSLGAPVGLGRVMINATIDQTPYPYLATKDQPYYRAAVSRTPTLLAYAQEMARTYDNIDYMRENRRAFDVPLVVISRGISATYDDPFADTTNEQQRLAEISLRAHWAALEELANTSEDGLFVVAEGSGHYIPVIAPQVIVDAVRDLVDNTP